jgi:hypothetical protein
LAGQVDIRNIVFFCKNFFCKIVCRLAYRQRMVEYRARFDASKNVKDLMKAKRLLIAGEDELKKAMYWHTDNFNCKNFTCTENELRIKILLF